MSKLLFLRVWRGHIFCRQTHRWHISEIWRAAVLSALAACANEKEVMHEAKQLRPASSRWRLGAKMIRMSAAK
jgi:hypothetical protein